MRICIVGNYFGTTLDEGQRNVTFYLYRELSKHHPVLLLSPVAMPFPGFWRSIRQFDPQIIHYVPGPSLKSFLVTKAMTLYCRRARTVMSAILPNLPHLTKKIVSLLRPDLMLTQSQRTEQALADLGFKVRFLPNGVDTEKFAPVNKELKQQLREKYGLDKAKFIVSHVGSLRQGRNVEALTALQRDNVQVFIVGRRHRTIELVIHGKTSLAVEKGIYQALKRKGCIVKTEYLENIEEIYALSDCYIFPTVNPREGIELPLSVMEAMSCNLPVISTRFGALPRLFESGDGFFFAEKEEEFVHLLDKAKNNNIEVKTREKVLPYSWANIAQQLEEIYSEVIGVKR